MGWIWAALVLALFIVPTAFAVIAGRKGLALARTFGEISSEYEPLQIELSKAVKPGLDCSDEAIKRAHQTRRNVALTRLKNKQKRAENGLRRWAEKGLADGNDIGLITSGRAGNRDNG